LCRVVVDRDPAAAAGMPACDLPIDVGDPDLGESDLAVVQPFEETVDCMEAAANGRFGPPALVAHPGIERCGIPAVDMPRLGRFVEQVGEAQPSHCVADEPPACVGRSGPAASPPAGQRPLIGRGFHACHADALALVQFQNANQADLVSRDCAQRIAPGASQGAVLREIEPFIQQRRGAIASDDAWTGEESLEHCHVSFLVGDMTMANGRPSENYVAAKRRVPVRGSPVRPLRNISRAATYTQQFARVTAPPGRSCRRSRLYPE